MTERPASTMRSVDRAFDVIEALENSERSLRLTEVARVTGLPIATTQRILGALQARGRVDQDRNGYSIGVASVIGAHSFALTNRLVTEVRPVMQVLARTTDLPVSLHIRWGWSRVIVDRCGVESERYSPSIGRKLPLHLGAAKVIAANLPAADREALIQHVGDFRRADGTAVTMNEHRDLLEQIQRDGFATSLQERVPGRFSAGAPIFTSERTCEAALVLGGRYRPDTPNDLHELAMNLREAAGEISSRHLDSH